MRAVLAANDLDDTVNLADQRLSLGDARLEQFLDTGQTLSCLVAHLHGLGLLSLRVAVLLRKEGRQRVPLEPDYCGFEIPDAFVVGYGLDFNGEYRNLPHVAVLPASRPAGDRASVV